MTTAKTKILIIDDEADIREILEFNIKNEGYDTDTASSAEEALQILSSEHCLILLDVMMGGMSGFHLAKKLRNEGNTIPIIFLTARDSENDMLTGFSTGGDDYISKPFSIKEVIARVKAVLKRSGNDSNTGLSVSDGLRINENGKQVFVNNNAIKLTKKEYEILYLLIKHSPRIFTRDDILNKVWQNESIVMERTIDVHITRLRKKLCEYGDYIINRSGYGYCFEIK